MDDVLKEKIQKSLALVDRAQDKAIALRVSFEALGAREHIPNPEELETTFFFGVRNILHDIAENLADANEMLGEIQR